MTAHGQKLQVTQVGPACPLTVGEVVTFDKPSMLSLLGGEVVSVHVIRQDGTSVEIRRGDGGAVFEATAA